MPADTKRTVRVAAVQAEGCYFDLEAAVEKTCKLIEEAAEKGCDLIAFPEVWIPNYPGWIWQRPIDWEMTVEYMKNSLKRDGPEMERICAAAAKHGIAVSLGYSENDDDSLYLSQSFISKDGAVKMNRRKIKPTHVERILYGDGSGASLMNVVEEPGVGARNLSTTHAIEGNCFVILSSSFFTQKGVDRQNLGNGKLYHIGGGGCACIIAPDGRIITQDLGEEEEGLIIADLDMDEIPKVKAMLDVHGHYSRPDLLWLGVDNREKHRVRSDADYLKKV
ncbi:hypothetical protein NW762_005483 [Fusarium torreyae]|uniref:nitrilase n=1 Tax=Fusarium torreyae TaxID=1237075 RepID=A0A9W8S594_9HYPO|nr:hypothetical protein NW762_005483 [Fusarium torreyae]